MRAVIGGRTVALCMIVRDEAAVLERCVASVDGIIDTWVVCDTGSVDGTPDVVTGAFGALPGTLLHHEWVHFGHNRSLLMDAARDRADLLLLLDADMTLEVVSPVRDLDPDVDSWLLRHAGELSYAVPRLVRGDRAWRFVGATHEHLAGDGEVVERTLDSLVVHHHADGGSRATKFERDAALLEAAVEAEPNDPRSWFYLAQTLRDLGRTAEAIEAYQRRIELGGWDEEVYYARYQAGLLQLTSDPAASAAALTDAWEGRPTRPEALHALAQLHRSRGQHRTAHLYAEAGLRLAPSDDRLFVHRDVERWGLRFERSISAYWVGDVETALVDTDAVLALPDLPAEVRTAAEGNRRLQLDRLADHTRPSMPVVPHLRDLVPDVRLGRIEVPVDPPWPRCNPALANDPAGGFRGIVRLVSYHIAEGAYRSVDDDERIRTHNVLLRLDEQLRPVDATLVDEPVDEAVVDGAPVLGAEDCRLVHHGGRWLAVATVRDRSPEATCHVAVLHLDGAVVTRAVVLDPPFGPRHEKNWMPVPGPHGPLRFVYACGPETVVVDADVDSGHTEVVASHPAHPTLAPWRGGSPLLPFDDGHLTAVHDVIYVDGRRAYRHRLVQLDADLRVVAATPWCSIEGRPIEFAAGLARHGDDDLALTYGVDDAEAGIALLPVAGVRRLLEPVPGRPGGAIAAR